MHILQKKEFKVFNTKYDVAFGEEPLKLENGDYEYGICHSAGTNISVSQNDIDKKPLDKQDYEKNAMHEIVHAILGEGGYINTSDDEPLVEWLARCMYDIVVNQDFFELRDECKREKRI